MPRSVTVKVHPFKRFCETTANELDELDTPQSRIAAHELRLICKLLKKKFCTKKDDDTRGMQRVFHPRGESDRQARRRPLSSRRV